MRFFLSEITVCISYPLSETKDTVCILYPLSETEDMQNVPTCVLLFRNFQLYINPTFSQGGQLKAWFKYKSKHYETCLYNVDPIKPHFYIVKLGLQGYTLFFLFLLKNKLWVRQF